jgi:predicted metal-dependent HD superfamily phosphohydrolase
MNNRKQRGFEKTPFRRAVRHVAGLLKSELPPWALYHSLNHTKNTVAACREIGKALGLKAAEMEVLLLAAWFHDAGYTIAVRGHEARSAEIAQHYLHAAGWPARTIRNVTGCILATRMPQRPRSLLQRALCDADLISLGKRSFVRHNELLRQEIGRRERRRVDERIWLHRSIRFLHGHRFATRYGRTVLEAGKQANIERLRRMIQRIESARGKKG